MYADTMNRLQPIRMSEGKCPRLTEPSSHRVDAEGLELLCTLCTPAEASIGTTTLEDSSTY